MIARRILIVLTATIFSALVAPLLAVGWFYLSEIRPQPIGAREFGILAAAAAAIITPVSLPAGFLAGLWLAWRAPRFTRWPRAALETLAWGILGGIAFPVVLSLRGQGPPPELARTLHVHIAIGVLTAALFAVLFGWLLVRRHPRAM